MSETRKLQVVSIETREVVHSVDVTGRSEREIETILRGMIRNMSDDFFVRDTGHQTSEEPR